MPRPKKKKSNMLRIGISGCIGSGKSTVANIFRQLGIPVYVADDRAKWLMTNHAEIRKGLVALFGEQAYLPTGELNRSHISAEAFRNKELLAQLNALVHPVVIHDFDVWSKSQAHTPYVLKEAALMFESDSYLQLNAVITVTSPEELRIHRTMVRSGLSKQEVMARMQNQMSEDEKKSRSQYIVVNDEINALLPQVLQLHEQFKQQSQNSPE
jgi:dephospho-CoA kinase